MQKLKLPGIGLIFEEGIRRYGTKVKRVLVTMLLSLLLTTTFLAIQNEVSAHAATPVGDTETAIPVGKYVALLEIPNSPPIPVPAFDGSYDVLFYNVGWILNGSVDGGPINIYILNDSNYQYFNSSRPYSAFQQLLSVVGPFELHIVLPSNGPNGTYVFHDDNVTYGWWIIFDNRVGLSNVTLSLSPIEGTGSFSFVFHQISIGESVLFLVTGGIAAVLFLVGVGIWKDKRRIR
jgi:hypothetical protein